LLGIHGLLALQWPRRSNWDGSVEFAPSLGTLAPTSVQDIQDFLQSHPTARVKVVGAGHSWSAIAKPLEYVPGLRGSVRGSGLSKGLRAQLGAQGSARGSAC
jgi:hypothetical protein